MHLALDQAKADPLTSLFFDDQPRNVHMGMDCGVRSVLVGDSEFATCEHFAHVPALHDLETKIFSSYFS
jgi:FMN phosphatase YigB (HAD superfamily)